MHRSRYICLFLAVLAGPGFVQTGRAAGSCEAVHFASGHDSGTVRGLAPADDVTCYTIAVGKGQAAHIKVATGANTVFSIDGLVDARTDYSFTTEKKTYRILVGQLMRATAPERFVLTVSIR